ncbi:MAG: DUF559 domain-containing protein [Pseudomonadota bacterium]
MKKLNITKQFLIDKYVNKRNSSTQIAKEIGCCHKTILRHLKQWNIQVRTNSESRKGQHKGKNNPMYGRRKEKAPAFKGDNAIVRKTYSCKEQNCNNKISHVTAIYGGLGRCSSCAAKISTTALWQDEKYRTKTIKAMWRGLKLSPNKLEKRLNKLLNKLFPNEYKFVGNGKIILGGFCPDFINVNGQKKIIELYGDYWHNLPDWKDRDKKRLIAYKEYGYQTLIIWEHEFEDLNRIKNKLSEFNKWKLIPCIF